MTESFETKVKETMNEEKAEMAKLEKETMKEDKVEMAKMDKVSSEKSKLGKTEEEVVGKVELLGVKEKEAEEVMERDVVDFDFLKLQICHKMHGGGKVASANIFVNKLDRSLLNITSSQLIF